MLTPQKTKFESALEYIKDATPALYDRIVAMPHGYFADVCELRLRAGGLAVIETLDRRIPVDVTVTGAHLTEIIKSFCGYSVYSHEKQLAEGFITLRGGHRAGFCGTAVYSNGRVTAIRDVSSINLRIAKEYLGCGEYVYERLFTDGENAGGFTGLLIAGPPRSAKTTVLRDLCRSVGYEHRVALLDERGEVAACYAGTPELSVGSNTDVLTGYNKSDGFLHALRSMSPEYVFCDEVAENEQLPAFADSGVIPVLTCHYRGSRDELVNSRRVHPATETCGISHVLILSRAGVRGEIVTL
ncbi:stage III sporulation protein AA [Clostridia bacterium]|nr:stage III sporulation protein AA [Clostridia bacterium]